MSDKTKIEWADASWNPVTGCNKVSEGCRNCYAMKFAERWRGTPGHYFEKGFDVILRPDKLDQPLKWKRPRRIFVNSMSDLFHDNVPDDFIDQVFAVMALAKHHTFQILTKRPERMLNYFESSPWKRWIKPMRRLGRIESDKGVLLQTRNMALPNVWLGVSVENQKAADERIPLLIQTPAAVRFLSCEPLLGPVNLWEWIDPLRSGWPTPQDIHWVIVGGESGNKARPMHPDWARSLRDQCQAAGVAFHFKQWGEWAPGENFAHIPSGKSHDFGEGLDDDKSVWRVGKTAAGRHLDGRTWDEFPEVRPDE